jgi:glycosyltransferase involved in cell wall biosynthesis
MQKEAKHLRTSRFQGRFDEGNTPLDICSSFFCREPHAGEQCHWRTFVLTGIFIVPSDIDSLRRKRVIANVLDRNERGFVTTVETIHPFAIYERTETVSANSVIHEFRQPESASWRVISWIRFLRHLVRVTWATVSIARKRGPAFIRAQDPYYCGLIGYAASRLSNRPFCVSIHSDYDKMFVLDPVAGAPRVFGSRMLAKQIERFVLKRADLVLAISEYIGTYALNNGTSREKIHTFRHVIDFSKYAQPVPAAAVERLKLPSSRRILSAVCRLSRQKFVYDLIELTKQLRNDYPDVLLAIAGDGEEAKGLRRLIDESGLKDHVRLLGFLDFMEVAALRQSSYVSLALLDGRSLIEACAAGRPVVGYDVEWHKEIIEDGLNGFLVREGDVAQLATAVGQLLADPIQADIMGAESRRKVLTMYAPETLLAQRRNVYQDLLLAGASRGAE